MLEWHENADTKIFFDKLIYQKSAEYGYCDGVCDYGKDGSRHLASTLLYAATDDVRLSQQALGDNTENESVIVLIGDSYVSSGEL